MLIKEMKIQIVKVNQPENAMYKKKKAKDRNNHHWINIHLHHLHLTPPKCRQYFP